MCCDDMQLVLLHLLSTQAQAVHILASYLLRAAFPMSMLCANQ